MSHGNIFPPPTPANKRTEKLVAGLNKINLSKHPTANKLVNLPQSVDNLAGGLNHDIGTAEQYAKWKNTEAKKLRRIEEDVGKLKALSKELNKDKKRLQKKLDHTCQELDQTRKRLVSSREEYTAIEKELDRVKEELEATQVQLDERSTFSTSDKVEKMREKAPAQRVELLDELQTANKEITILKKQLAGGMASNVANVANSVASYKPRSIGSKNQLTGTDPTAYAPWKWAVNDKLRVDTVMYPDERDRISYAFHQLAQPIFQQLDAWIDANSKGLTMEEFHQQIEHCMGIHMLTEQAKDELHTVTMKSNETVDEYYQQIFKLWEQAKTPERERIRRFKITLKLSISHALIG